MVIRNAVTISEEVQSGAVFGSVRLYNVDDPTKLESSAQRILALTYPTQALRQALSAVTQRLSGERARGTFIFAGDYGTGKSHSLLALYHILHSPDDGREWLDRWGIDLSFPEGMNVVTSHLLDEETLAWLSRFAGIPLNDRRRLALAYLRVNAALTNTDYRRLHHGAVETVEATRELRSLVETGLVEMHSTRRWAYYTLSETTPRQVQLALPEAMSDEEKIIAYVEQHGSINNAECRRLLGIENYKKAGAFFGNSETRGSCDRLGRGDGHGTNCPDYQVTVI